MEKLADDLLLVLRFVKLEILSTSFIDFLYVLSFEGLVNKPCAWSIQTAQEWQSLQSHVALHGEGS